MWHFVDLKMISYSWNVLQKQIERVMESSLKNRVKLIKKDEESHSVFLVLNPKGRKKKYTLRIIVSNKFPIDPPSVIFVNNMTLKVGKTCWPKVSHCFPPGRWNNFPDGWICLGYTKEYKEVYGKTEWGFEKGQLNTLYDLLLKIEDIIKGEL